MNKSMSKYKRIQFKQILTAIILLLSGILTVHIAAQNSQAVTIGREQSQMDFGWRFAFGNANDPAKDFDLGNGPSWTK
jgi:hypothetical protein